MNPKTEPRTAAAPSFMQVVKSVAALFFGVQSSKNRRRDFSSGSPLPFIVVGFGMTALVVLTFWTAAQLALRVTGH